MARVSAEISRVAVTDELRACPECGYDLGFHVSFIARQGSDSLSLILLCPGCGSRLDIGRIICRAPACAETGSWHPGTCRVRSRARA